MKSALRRVACLSTGLLMCQPALAQLQGRSVGDVLKDLRAQGLIFIYNDQIVPANLREKRYPTRHDLDRVAPRNPVYVRSIWGYWRHTLPLVSIANSEALRRAAITAETRPPWGGRVGVGTARYAIISR